jgi:1-acyl-sn-glycerol-3-phosphate acyltransferase
MASNYLAEPPYIFTEKTATYWIVRFVTGLALRLRYRMRVEGLEHVPSSGAALIVANHQSVMDIPAIASSTRRHVSFVARASLARYPALGLLLRETGAVLIEPGKGDRVALRAMVEHLDRGDLVTIFPEGTRSMDGRVGEFKGGALLAARKAKVPIIPLVIRGSQRIWPRGQEKPGPGRILLRFLPSRSAEGKNTLEDVRNEIDALVGDGRVDGF